MKAEELRIGNWVKLPVYIAEETELKESKVSKITKKDIYVEMNGYGYHATDICKPIPITEEWLERFGFDNTEDGYLRILPNEQWLLIDNPSWLKKETWLSVYLDDCEITFVKHIHSLQNLYFALTGEELNPEQ